MVALSLYMRSHGYDPQVDKHTSVAGIWEKLESLYNLEEIDERENYEMEEDMHLDFDLPFEYQDELWERGRASPTSDAPTSPAQYNPSPSPPRKRARRDAGARKRGSTVDDTDEPRTSPPASPSAKPKRGRAATRSSGRTRAESSSRAPSKDTAQEEEEVEDSDEVEDEEEDGDEESVTASEKQVKGKSRASTTSTRKSKRKR